jgi:hypothetical protein
MHRPRRTNQAHESVTAVDGTMLVVSRSGRRVSGAAILDALWREASSRCRSSRSIPTRAPRAARVVILFLSAKSIVAREHVVTLPQRYHRHPACVLVLYLDMAYYDG